MVYRTMQRLHRGDAVRARAGAGAEERPGLAEAAAERVLRVQE